MTQRCAWCDEPLTSGADPVELRTKHGESQGTRLHHDCAVEWQTFITRADYLATIGNRWALIDGPLQNGWELESGIQR